MDYKIKEETPVKKTIEIHVSPEEVDAALAGTVALYKDSAQMDGFRKGKAPASVVEKKYHDQIYDEAKENLLNVHINDILTQLNVTPVSGIYMEGDEKPLEKGKEYDYVISFEVLPKFPLPPYEGLKVEEEKSVLNDKELDMVFERMREEAAALQGVQGQGPAQDGQIAVIDFEAFMDGKPLKDFKATNFNLGIGRNEALPDFEKIVKGIPKGHSAEAEIKMPDDFLVEELAGKNVNFKITVHDIKERILPEFDDNFAKKRGFSSLDQLKEIVKSTYLSNIKKMNKGVAQRKLLNQLLEQCEFEIPKAMLDLETRYILANEGERLERQGKSLAALGKNLDELKEEVKPRATDMAKDKILLLSIAKKENLEVTPEELQKNVYKNCLLHGEDFQEVMKNLEKHGLIFHLRDQMICDKAMDLVYDRAEVSIVEPEQDKEEKSAEAPEAAAAKKTEEPETNAPAPEAKAND